MKHIWDVKYYINGLRHIDFREGIIALIVTSPTRLKIKETFSKLYSPCFSPHQTLLIRHTFASYITSFPTL